MAYKLIFTLSLLAMTANSHAQNLDIDNLSLEDLLNIKTSVASKTEKSTRESPGIVTVITKEEIAKMGARDLIDVLNMVPGFSFAHDVQGVVGLTVRGNWAHEGKFSLMVDGQEMNELLYSSTQFGNHYPVDHIKQIEIIRGPGSAIYGGFAELAVVHVITEKGADIEGARATLTYGQMREGLGRRNLSVQVGKKIGDWDVSIAGLMGQGRRGDGTYVGYASNTSTPPPPNYNHEVYEYSDSDANNLNPTWLNVGVSNGSLDFRFIYDNYQTTSRNMYGFSGLTRGLPSDFESMYASLKYDFKPNEAITITPYFNYKDQNPWRLTDPDAVNVVGTEIFDASVNRTRFGLSALFQFSESTNLLLGTEYYIDKAHADSWVGPGGPVVFSMTGTDEIEFDGLAAYTQLTHNFEFFETTLGARYEELNAPTNRKVSKTVPRFAITKASEKWHVKGLASQAYRVPSVFNFVEDFNVNGVSVIKPETTTTYEIEGGIALSSKSYLTANLFSIRIDDPIIYEYTGTDDFYRNYPRVETQGFEVEYKKKSKNGFTNVNYSFYQRGTNEVSAYAVPGRKELLGIPQHKLTYLSSFRTGIGKWVVTPSVVYMRSRSTYEYDIASDTEVLRQLPSVTLVNVYFTYPNLFVKGLEFGVGVFNLWDEENRFVQPYNSELGNVPAPSREFLARLTYTMPF
jgi:outer membrane receptor for ferrienterochelin and colicin